MKKMGNQLICGAVTEAKCTKGKSGVNPRVWVGAAVILIALIKDKWDEEL
jgi:hypothetical protein